VSEPVRIALTFDAEHPDRPAWSPGGAERILDVLRGVDARCTFFVQSRWAEANPAVARRIAEEGHLIGNHSAYHARMSLLNDGGIRADVRQAHDALVAIIGADPRPWFRCPFGDGRDDPRVLAALDELGYRNVHWSVETEDWEPSRSADDVAGATVDRALEHGDGAVVLLHTWPEPTARGLPSALDRLGRSNTKLVTIDELDELP
jgi:peptidoglycan-N-acetylglucosamine deacetylase